MTFSPFAYYQNAELTFQVSGGALVQDSKGNWRPGNATVKVTALLEQAKPPEKEPQPGVDSSAVYLEGWAIAPMQIPSVVTPDSRCVIVWQGRRGEFFLEFTARDAWGAAALTGDEIRGYFQASSLTIEGEAWEPTPEAAPSSDGKQYTSRMIAATALSALRVVTVEGGMLVYASSDNLAHANAVTGLLTQAIAAGSGVAVLTDGLVSDSSWAWAMGIPIFLGVNGVLTQVVPESGFLLQVATPIDSRTISFEIQEPILL